MLTRAIIYGCGLALCGAAAAVAANTIQAGYTQAIVLGLLVGAANVLGFIEGRLK